MFRSLSGILIVTAIVGITACGEPQSGRGTTEAQSASAPKSGEAAESRASEPISSPSGQALTLEEFQAICELSKKLAASRKAGRFLEAAADAERILEIRRTRQGDAWFETRDALEEVRELQALSKLSESDRASALISDRLREEGLEYLMSVGGDGRKRKQMLQAAKRIAQWRHAHFDASSRMVREGDRWVLLCQYLASPGGRQLSAEATQQKHLGLAKGDLRRAAELIAVSGRGDFEEISADQDETTGGAKADSANPFVVDPEVVHNQEQCYHTWMRCWLAVKRARFGEAARHVDALIPKLQEFHKSLGGRSLRQFSDAQMAKAHSMGMGAFSDWYQSSESGLEPWALCTLAEDIQYDGAASPRTALSWRTAGLLMVQKARAEAPRYLAQAIRARRATSSDLDPDVLQDLVGLAFLMGADDPESGVGLLREAGSLFLRLEKGEGGSALASRLLADGLFDVASEMMRRTASQAPPSASAVLDAVLQKIPAPELGPLPAGNGESPVPTEPISEFKPNGESEAEQARNFLQKYFENQAPEKLEGMTAMIDLSELNRIDDRFPGLSKDAFAGKLKNRGDYTATTGPLLTDAEWELARRVEARLAKASENRAARDMSYEAFRPQILRGEELLAEGSQAWARAELAQAEKLLREALQIALSAPELANQARVARLRIRAELELGGLLTTMGRDEEARDSCDKSLRSLRAIGTSGSDSRREMMVALTRASTVHRRLGNLDEAAQLDAEAVELLRKEVEALTVQRDLSQGMLGFLAKDPAALDKSTNEFQDKLTRDLEKGLEGNPEKEKLLKNAGESLSRSAEFMAKMNKNLVDRTRVPRLLEEARNERARGNYFGAESKLKECAAALANPNERDDGQLAGRVAMDRAQIAEDLGQLDVAAAHYKEAVASMGRARSNAQLLQRLAMASRARVELVRGELESGLALLERTRGPLAQADETSAGALGFDAASILQDAWFAGASAYARSGQLDRAEEFLRDCVKYSEELWAENPTRKVREEAKKVMESESIKKRIGDVPKNPLIGQAELGDFFADMFRASTEMPGMAGGGSGLILDQRRLARARARLAELLLRKGTEGSRSEAQKLFALALIDQRATADPWTYQTATHFAELLLSIPTRAADAQCLLREAMDGLERERRWIPGDESSRAGRMSELVDAADPYALALRVVLAQTTPDAASLERALADLERGRGRALLDLLRGRRDGDIKQRALSRVAASSDPTMRERFVAISARETAARDRAEEIQKKISSSTEADESEKRPLIQELTRVQQSERAARLEYRTLAQEGSHPTLEQPWEANAIRKALRPDELLIYYDIGERDGWVLSLGKSAPTSVHPLRWSDGAPVDRQSLKTAVEAVCAAFTGSQRVNGGEPAAAQPDRARDLAFALVPGALRTSVASSARVFVVTDSALHALPFEALLVPDSMGKPRMRWIDVWPPVVCGPSATTLLEHRGLRQDASGRPAESAMLVALGNPQFSLKEEAQKRGGDTQLGQLAAMLEKLPALPGTEAEVRAISAAFQRARGASGTAVRTFVGPDATPENLYSAAVRPEYLHLGTHGFAASGKLVYESCLALAGDRAASRLRLSDLLDSWTNRLEGTKVVTLSACQTATGSLESRDGVVALLWGFLSAGAETVVATRWSIDDRASALLMERLYQNFLGDFESPRKVAARTFPARAAMPRLEALREAQLWLRSLDASSATAELARLFGPQENPKRPLSGMPFAGPEYWAAFQLMGSPDE
ncbi:MAG: CHAT domain-containing protein [Planctomycetes bacterium]|nr:CHAT domain-containing protein [Planctomycetota bacterium]